MEFRKVYGPYNYFLQVHSKSHTYFEDTADEVQVLSHAFEGGYFDYKDYFFLRHRVVAVLILCFSFIARV